MNVKDSTNELNKSHKKGKKRTENIILPHEAKLSSAFNDDELKNKTKAAFKEKSTFTQENTIVLHNQPFQCCQMSKFLDNDSFLSGLRDELVDQIFYEKNNDLYKFQQTDDLRKISTPYAKAIRQFFRKDFRDWLSDVCNITFSDQMDLTCSTYNYTDILLCHDDELDSRRVAFVLYLVPPWTDEDGGLLDLFSMDEYGQAKEVVKSLTPSWNTLVWFEVTEASHHQVSEVLVEGKSRLSVHGWFHSVPVPRPARYVEPPAPLHQHIHIQEEMVYEWLNPIYLDAAVQSEIRDKFEENSEIELQGFLKEEKYQELTDALNSRELNWQHCGPANKRSFDHLTDDNLPEIVQQCVQFMKSEAIFLILSNLTGLRLHRLAPKPQESRSSCSSEPEDESTEVGGSCDKEQDEGTNSEGSGQVAVKRPKLSDMAHPKEPTIGHAAEPSSERSTEPNPGEQEVGEDTCNPHCRYQVRRWRPGCYTLVHDTDAEGCEFALDAVLYSSCKGWQQSFGGFTSYIAKGEDEELLTICPVENSLALVYRDKDTLKFVKHINHRMSCSEDLKEFHDLSFVYFE